METKISRDEDIKHDQPKEDVEEEEEVYKRNAPINRQSNEQE